MDRGKKLTIIVIGCVIVLILLFFVSETYIINSRNLYAKEANSVGEAQAALKKTDLTKGSEFGKKDFYGEYVPNTSFVISYEGRVYYDQGYYMVYKDNYKIVYCIDPLTTAWSVTNLNDLEDYNNTEFASLSQNQKNEVTKLVFATQKLYDSTKDEQYLVAGQLLVWQAIGSRLNDYSTNLQDNMNDIKKLSNSLTSKDMGVGSTAPTANNSSDMLYYNTQGQDLIAPKSTGNGNGKFGSNNGSKSENTKPSIQKTSSADSKAAENGTDVKYTIKVVNKSSKVQDIRVQDSVSDDNLNVDTRQKLKINGQSSKYTIGDLQKGIVLQNIAPGDKSTITYTVTVDQTDSYKTGDGIKNTAKACINTSKCASDTDMIDSTGNPDLVVDKSIIDSNDDSIAEPGETLNFTILVQNKGNKRGDATVTEALEDPYMSYDLQAPILIDGKESQYTVGDLQKGILLEKIEPSQTEVITFSAPVVDNYDVENNNADTEIENTAKACVDPAKDKTCSEDTDGMPTTGFNVEKTVQDANGDGYAEAGETLTYTIAITNESAESRDYTLTDNIPINHTIVDDKQTLQISDAKKTIPKKPTIKNMAKGVTIQSIDSGETVRVSFNIRVEDNLDTSTLNNEQIGNIATVTTEGETSQSDGVSIPFQGGTPIPEDMSINKTVQDQSGNNVAEEGEVLTYTIDLVNGADKDMTVVVKDALDDQNIDYDLDTKLDVVSTDTGEFISPSTPAERDLKNGVSVKIAANSKFEFTFTGTVKDSLANTNSQEISNYASMCVDTDCTGTSSDIPLREKNDFDVVKTVKDANGNDIAEPGEELFYTITVTNSGNTTTSTTLIDSLPGINIAPDLIQKLSITSDNPIVTTPVDPTLSDLTVDGVTLQDMTPDQTVTITFDLPVSDPLENASLSHITNTATTCYDKSTKDNTQICESSVATTTTDKDAPIPPDNAPRVNKTITDESEDNIVSADEKLTFDLKVTNPDSQERTITVTDPLDDENIKYINSQELVLDDDTNASFVADHTVGDLPTGVPIKIAANSSADISYTARLAKPIVNTNAVITTNTVKVCDEVGCDQGGDSIPIEANPNFSVNKKVAVNGNENKNTVTQNDELDYTVQITNTGNVELNNLKLTDLRDEDIYVDPSSIVTVTSDNGNSVSTTPENPTGSDLDTGITINNIAIGDTITIQYQGNANIDSTDGQNKTLSNIANICADDTCKSGNATVTTDDNTPVTNPDIGAVKEITDEDGDDVASPGEKLTFHILVSNESQTEEKITLTDKLDDVNLEVDPNESITIDPASINVTPENPTVSDLQTGINMIIPAQSDIDVSFATTVKNSDEEYDTTKAQITNIATACTSNKCVDGGDDIPTPEGRGFDIQKDVLINGLDSPENTTAEAGDRLDYTITLTNTQNTPINTITLTDVEDKNIVTDPTADVTIKDPAGNTVDTTPPKPTISDLLGDGVIINDDINPGESLTISYKGEVSTGIANHPENKILSNIATACTPLNAGSGFKSNSSPVGDKLCGSDSASISVYPTADVPTNGIAIVKNIEETDDPKDGQVDPGEDLSFSITVSNSSDSTQDVVVKDALKDSNIDYQLSQQLTINPSAENITPSDPVVGDLQDGITVSIPAGQSVSFSFTSKAFNPFPAPTASNVSNVATACVDTECTSGGADLPIVGKEGFNIEKNVDVLDDDDTDDPSYVQNGDNLHYTITVENNRNRDINNVLLKDIPDSNIVIPTENLTITSNQGDSSYTPAEATTDDLFNTGITFGTLKVGEIITIEYDAKASDTIENQVSKDFTNVATACSPDSSDGNKDKLTSQSSDTDNGLCASSAATVTTDKKNPIDPTKNIHVNKKIEEPTDSADDIATPGEKLTFVVSIVNTGETDQSVKVTDPLNDPNIDYDMTSSLELNPSTTTTTPTYPTLDDLQAGLSVEVPAGQAVTLSYTGTVSDSLHDPKQTEVQNSVTACDDGDYCQDAGDSLSLPGIKGFDIQKNVEETDGTTDNVVIPGEKLTYNIVITNDRNRDIDDVNVTDVIDQNITPESALKITSNMDDNPINNNPNEYTTDDLYGDGITISEFRVGETITFSYDAMVNIDADQAPNKVFSNIATATAPTTSVENNKLGDQSSDTDNGLSASDTSMVTTDSEIPIGKYGIVKNVSDESADGIAQNGENLTYEITVTNPLDTSQNIKVQDKLDDVNMAFNLSGDIDVNPSSAVITDSSGNTLNIVTEKNLQDGINIEVPAGQSVVLTYTGTVQDDLTDPTAKAISNLVTACDDKNSNCNDAGSTIPLSGNPNFALTKEASPAGGSAVINDGEQVTYTITVQNTGNRTINNFKLTDITDDNIVTNGQDAIAIDSSSTQQDATIQNSDGSSATISGLLSPDGLVINKIDPGETVVVKYNGTIDLTDGKDTGEAQDSKEITNMATACASYDTITRLGGSARSNGDQECATDTAQVTTDQNGISNDGVGVLKTVTDEDENKLSNGIANPGDLLTFNVYITNNTEEDQQYTVKDPTDDKNLNYDVSENIKLESDPIGSFVFPTSPTIGDLPNGIKIEVPAYQTAQLSYHATVKDPYSETTAKFIKNNVEACTNPGDPLSCSDSGVHLPLETGKGVSVEKSAITKDEDKVVDYGESYKYEITMVNTGNTTTDISLNDNFPSELLDIPDDSITLDFSPYQTTPESPTIGDLIGDGIIVHDVEPGGTVTIDFLVNVKDPLQINGEDYKGQITNTVSACTVTDKTNADDRKLINKCDSSEDTVTTDDSNLPVDGLGVQKTVSDPVDAQTSSYSNNDDDVVDPGERLQFDIRVVNSSDQQQNYTVTDSMKDENVDYSSEAAQKLEQVGGGGEFNNPKKPTVSDLSSSSGIDVDIPAGDYIEFTYYANVLKSLNSPYNTEISNTVTVCNSDGNCNQTDAIIPMQDYSRLSIEKSYTTDQHYRDSTTGKDIDYVNDSGQNINYTIKIANNGTQDISNFVIQDNMDNDYLVNDGSIPILIYDSAHQLIDSYTAEDLMSGITYDEMLSPDDYITVEFTMVTSNTVVDKLNDDDTIPNVASVCYDDTKTEYKICPSSGVETPYDTDGNIVPPADGFTIVKEISDDPADGSTNGNNDGIIQPSEDLVMKIDVTNNLDTVEERQNIGPTKDYTITDDFTDKNLNYVGALANEVTVTNLSTGKDVDFSPNPAFVNDLDSENGTGIKLSVPDGETVEVSFHVSAKRNLS